MKKKVLNLIIGFCFLLTLTSSNLVKADNLTITSDKNNEIKETEYIDYKTEKLKTNYISMDGFIDTTKEEYKLLSQKEVESLFNSIGEKSFKEIDMININHDEKTATIQFRVNEDDGNIDTLISTGIYNFLKGTKEFVQYSITFEVTGRYTDSNGRYMKKLLYIYKYKPETLISLDWNNLNLSDICNYSDEIWDENKQETITSNKNEEASLQIKIMNILKYYITEKIN